MIPDHPKTISCKESVEIWSDMDHYQVKKLVNRKIQREQEIDLCLWVRGWRPCQKVNYVLPIDRPSSLQRQRKLQIFCLQQQATMGCCQQHAALACCMHGLWPAGYVSSKQSWLVASMGSHGLMPICHNSSKQPWLAA